MLQAFKRLFSELTAGGTEQHRFQDNDYRLAAAALLFHAATIDGNVSDAERSRLRTLMMQRFDLDDAAVDDLIGAAAEAEQQAIDLYSFTSLLNRSLDDAGRRQVVEMMWQVVQVDGKVTEFEDNLLWRAADLLHVPSDVRIELRRRVAQARAEQDPGE